MDDFAKKAFADAEAINDEKEFEAYKKAVVGDFENILTAVAHGVGMVDMNQLSGIILRNGHAVTMAEFVRDLCTICFHLGYEEGRMA